MHQYELATEPSRSMLPCHPLPSSRHSFGTVLPDIKTIRLPSGVQMDCNSASVKVSRVRVFRSKSRPICLIGSTDGHSHRVPSAERSSQNHLLSQHQCFGDLEVVCHSLRLCMYGQIPDVIFCRPERCHRHCKLHPLIAGHPFAEHISYPSNTPAGARSIQIQSGPPSGFFFAIASLIIAETFGGKRNWQR